MKENSDSKLIETSRYGSINNAPINEIGIPSDTQNANFGLRNMASINKTRIRPNFAFFNNKLILPLRIFDSSFQLVICTPLGSDNFVLCTDFRSNYGKNNDLIPKASINQKLFLRKIRLDVSVGIERNV